MKKLLLPLLSLSLALAQDASPGAPLLNADALASKAEGAIAAHGALFVRFFMNG